MSTPHRIRADLLIINLCLGRMVEGGGRLRWSFYRGRCAKSAKLPCLPWTRNKNVSPSLRARSTMKVRHTQSYTVLSQYGAQIQYSLYISEKTQIDPTTLSHLTKNCQTPAADTYANISSQKFRRSECNTQNWPLAAFIRDMNRTKWESSDSDMVV